MELAVRELVDTTEGRQSRRGVHSVRDIQEREHESSSELEDLQSRK